MDWTGEGFMYQGKVYPILRSPVTANSNGTGTAETAVGSVAPVGAQRKAICSYELFGTADATGFTVQWRSGSGNAISGVMPLKATTAGDPPVMRQPLSHADAYLLTQSDGQDILLNVVGTSVSVAGYVCYAIVG